MTECEIYSRAVFWGVFEEWVARLAFIAIKMVKMAESTMLEPWQKSNSIS